MQDRLEHTLAFHCAPAMAGIKPSSLVCCDRERYPNLEKRLRALQRQLAASDIRLRPVCRCGSRVLVLVYCQQVLDTHLAHPEVKSFLEQAGYPVRGTEEILQHLELRLHRAPTFPHEAGIILGYPQEDVEGFCRHKGQNCKLSGYWKVYGDADRARVLFSRYTQCREVCCGLLEQGMSLCQLFCAA